MEKAILISALLVALSLPVSATSGSGMKRSANDVISFTTAKNKLYLKRHWLLRPIGQVRLD